MRYKAEISAAEPLKQQYIQLPEASLKPTASWWEKITLTAIIFLMSSNIHEHLSLISAGKGWLAQEGRENLVCDAHMGNCVIFQFKPHVLGVSWRKAT